MKRFKEALLAQAQQSNSSRGILIALVGSYIIYMGVQMLRNTQSGLSTMSMPLTLVLMSVMILAGAGVAVYGGFIFWSGWKRQRESIPEEKNENSQE